MGDVGKAGARDADQGRPRGDAVHPPPAQTASGPPPPEARRPLDMSPWQLSMSSAKVVDNKKRRCGRL